MIEAVKNISSILGLIATAATLVTIAIRPIRKRVIGRLRLKSKMSRTDREISQLKSILEKQLEDERIRRQDAMLYREALKCLLRDDITHLYYKRLPERAIHAYELENITSLYDTYILLGGNSFVKEIYRKMSTEWQVIK